MAFFDFNITDETLGEIYEQKYGTTGVFKFGPGGYRAGHKTTTDVTEALEHVKNMGLASFYKFDMSKPYGRVGTSRFRSRLIESMNNVTEPGLRRLIRNLSIEVSTHEGDAPTLKKVLEDLIRPDATGKRTSYGLTHMNKNLTAVRMFFKDGTELTSKQIEDILGRVGFNWAKEGGAGMSAAGERFFDAKTRKRFATILSQDEYGEGYTKPFIVHRINNSNKLFTDAGFSANAIQTGLDGITVANPVLLRTHISKMVRRAKELQGVEGDSLEAKAIQRSGDALMSRALQLKATLKSGGSFETLRAMGLVDTSGNHIHGMLKSDMVVPNYAGWTKLAKAADLKDRDIKRVGFITHMDNITKQQGLEKWGKSAFFATFKPNHPNKYIWADAETLLAQPDLYPISEMTQYTENVVMSRLDDFMKTGTLDDDLVEHFQELLQRTGDELKPGETLLSLADAQRRAEFMLDRHYLGIDPKEDVAYANEFFNSMMQWVRGRDPIEKKGPRFLAKGTVGAHIRPSIFAQEGGWTDYDVAPGELGFHRRYGLIMNESDIYRGKALFGGFDLDDLLRAHVVNVNGQIMAVGVRNPHDVGETAGFVVNPHSYDEFVQALATSHPEIRKEAAYLQAKTDIDRIGMDINKTYTQIDNLTAQGKPTDKLENQLRRHQIDLKNARDRLHTSADEIGDKAGELTAESLIKKVYVELSPEEFEKFNLGLLKHSPTEESIDVIKSPLFRSYKEWEDEMKRTGQWKNFKPLKPKDILTVKDLNLDELEESLGPLTRGLMEANVPASAVYGLLGQYRNVAMTASSLQKQVADKIKAGEITLKPGQTGIIPFVPNEDIVDVLTMGVKRPIMNKAGEVVDELTVENAMQRMSAMIYGMAQAVGEFGVKLPGEAFSRRMMGPEGKSPLGELFFSSLHTINPSLKGANIILDRANPTEAKYDIYGEMMDETRRFEQHMKTRVKNQWLDQFGIPSGFERYYSAESRFQAARIVETMSQARKGIESTLSIGSLENEYVSGAMEILSDSKFSLAAQQATRVASEVMFNEAGELTDKGLEIAGAIFKYHPRAALETRAGIGDVMGYARVHAMTGGGEKLDEMLATGKITEPQKSYFEKVLEKRPTIRQMQTDLPRYVNVDTEGLDREVINRIEKGLVPGRLRSQESRLAAGLAEDVALPKDTKFVDMSIQGIKDLYREHPGVKKGTIAAAALVAGSFLYQKLRDRTPEQMQGPPLLPGGSAYEDSTGPSMPPPLDGGGAGNTYGQGGGVTYRVVARGDFDHEKARGQAENITGATASGTIYNTRTISRFGREIPEAILKAFRGGI